MERLFERITPAVVVDAGIGLVVGLVIGFLARRAARVAIVLVILAFAAQFLIYSNMIPGLRIPGLENVRIPGIESARQGIESLLARNRGALENLKNFVMLHFPFTVAFAVGFLIGFSKK
ncbi:MAG: FUN14 domain-containing protein [bacterium]